MTRLATLTTTLGLALLASGAQAQGLYGEVGYTGLDYKGSGLKASPGMVRGVMGYELTPLIAVEGMAGLGARSGSASGNTIKLDNTIGVFGKAGVPVTEALNLYGRVGVARTAIKTNGASASSTGVAWGAGASYDLSQTTYLNVDYTRYLDKDSRKLGGITAGVGFRF